MNGNLEPVIGLEVHAQLATRSKIFCGCATAFGAAPNTHTCPVCLGMPGVLPVLNRTAVDYALRMALAVACEINGTSRFARKNYFYPDLPKGYQISQYEQPLARQGRITIDVDGEEKTIGITRIHLEEDAGKLLHDPSGGGSRVDLNRTGVPLIEIVSEPDMRTPEEAGAYLRNLHAILRYLDICDGNMEEGSFRCDANISLRPQGTTLLGTRTELKNLNSFRHVEKALHYEIERQRLILQDGGQIVQETRLWNSDTQRTTSMRGKEEAHDYRYFPDPDLVALVIDDDWRQATLAQLPELPEPRRKRLMATYNLPAQDAKLLTSSRELADYFEACVALNVAPKLVSSWIMGPLQALLNARGQSIAAAPLSPEHLSELLTLVANDTISSSAAKTVLETMMNTGQTAAAIVAEQNLAQVRDTSALDSLVSQVLAQHPEEVAACRQGKTKLLSFLVGQVMKASRGKADPKRVNSLLRARLTDDSAAG